MDEVKKKWKDLLSKAKKDASLQKNPPTGGGPRQQISPYSDIILDIYGKESPSVIGIANAIESASASVPLAVEEEKECREYDAVSIITQVTRSPNAREIDKRQDLLTSEDPEIGEACDFEVESLLVEGIPMFSLFKLSLSYYVCEILHAVVQNKISLFITDSSTTREESSKSGAVYTRRTDKKPNFSDQLEKVQLQVLTAELSRIEAEKRKFEVEKEVLLLKKKKLELELEKMGSVVNIE